MSILRTEKSVWAFFLLNWFVRIYGIRTFERRKGCAATQSLVLYRN